MRLGITFGYLSMKNSKSPLKTSLPLPSVTLLLHITPRRLLANSVIRHRHLRLWVPKTPSGYVISFLSHSGNIVKRLAPGDLGVDTHSGPGADGCREAVRSQCVRIIWPYGVVRNPVPNRPVVVGRPVLSVVRSFEETCSIRKRMFSVVNAPPLWLKVTCAFGSFKSASMSTWTLPSIFTSLAFWINSQTQRRDVVGEVSTLARCFSTS